MKIQFGHITPPSTQPRFSAFTHSLPKHLEDLWVPPFKAWARPILFKHFDYDVSLLMNDKIGITYMHRGGLKPPVGKQFEQDQVQEALQWLKSQVGLE